MNKFKKTGRKGLEDIIALTPLQEGMLFHYLKDPQSQNYFEQLSLEISGHIRREIFEKAWNAVIKANKMLRTAFQWGQTGKPVQLVLKAHRLEPVYYGLTNTSPEEWQSKLEAVRAADRQNLLDPGHVPFRVTLCKLRENKYEMIISHHHILMDGWSMGILLKEFFQAYDDLYHNKKASAPVKTNFKEFVKWIQQQDVTHQAEYWKNYLEDFHTPQSLPIKRAPARGKGSEGVETFTITIPGETIKQWEQWLQDYRLTMAALLYGGWGLLLQNYTDSNDVVFGTTLSLRPSKIKGIEELVGLLINTVPLRVNSTPGNTKNSGISIIDLLKQIKKNLQNMEVYGSCSLVNIKEYSGLTHYQELFDTLVVLENYPLDQRLTSGLHSLTVDSYSIFEMTHYDLTVGIVPSSPAGKDIRFLYNSNTFQEDAIRRLANHYISILKEIIKNPGRDIREIDLLSREEKRIILTEFNRPAVEYPFDKTVPGVFAEQAERTPDRTALQGCMITRMNRGEKFQITNSKLQTTNNKQTGVLQPHPDSFGEIQLSYGLLDEEANRLAFTLLEKGVHTDTIVGIMMERSVEMVFGIIGTWKAGGAYIPISPGYPQERIDYILKDSGARMLVTTNNKEDEKYFEILFFDTPLSTSLQNSNLPNFTASQAPNYHFLSATHHRPGVTSLAYIIYTSGSTGKPKGAMVEHSGMMNHISAKISDLQISRNSVAAQNASHTFDISVWQFFAALTRGGKTVIYPEEVVLNPERFISLLIHNQITILEVVPSYLSLILSYISEENVAPLSLEYLLITGEEVKAHLVKQWFERYPRIKMVNAYGPTEASDDITHYIMEKAPGTERIPIGKPLQNFNIYILNENMNLCPIGVMGEICVAGIGVGRGYLNNPALTAEKFVISVIRHSSLVIGLSKSSPGTNDQCLLTNDRLYKTGDLGRWLPGGSIEFFGRTDYQVKIHGFRIEPGEIENHILNHPGIKEVVVIDRAEKDEDKYLCAYIVSGPGYGASELREHLSKELPDYMIPLYFISIEKIPLTPNGKIDRKALPKPGLKDHRVYAAPTNQVETKLVELWSDVLKVERGVISIDRNFFELGGHSLNAMILAARIHKAFDVRVPLAEIFRMPKIKELAKYIKEKSKERYISIDPAEEKEYFELSPAQKRLYVLQQLVTNNTSYNMPYVIPLRENVEKEKLESIFKRLIERHDSLRTSFITVNQEPVQRIHRQVDFSIDCYEIKEELEDDSIISRFTRPFNLYTAPLLRLHLAAVGSSRRVLFLDMHHIISDGTSEVILEKEFLAFSEGEVLQPLRLQYKDYSEWNNSARRQKVIKQQENFWMTEFAGEIPVLNLPTDYPRPLVQSVAGNWVSFSFNEEETRIVKRIAAENHSTLFMCLLAVFNVLLSKLSGQEDIIIGTPIAARRHADLQDVIGMLVNTLAIRNYPAGEKSFREFLKEVNRRILDAYENQEYPFEVLVDKITVNRDTSRNPVFDVMFNVLNQTEYNVDSLEHNNEGSYLHIRGTSKFDMNLASVEIGERIFFTLEYSTSLFKPASIERIIGYYKNILKLLSRDTGLKISAIEIMDKQELEAVLSLSRGMENDYEEIKTLHRWFEKQAARTPDHIALHGCMIAWMNGKEGSLTYKELNEKSNLLANHLRKKGVGPDSIVGLMVERSVEMIIGMLGIMKAGGAYLPIDPEYPAERKRYMLADGETRWLLVNDDLEDIGADMTHQLEIIEIIEIIDLGQEEIYKKRNNSLEYVVSGSHLVYVIYTSGSTGKPKGVMLEHRNLVNLLKFQFKYTNIDCSRILQFSTISFDASFHEIFSAFLSGGMLCLVNKETRTDIPELFGLIEKNGIKTVFLPISFLKVIFKEEEYIKRIPQCIRHIQTAGEQVVISDNFRKYLREKKVYLHNHYGPSETHVVTALTMEPVGDIPELPSIGKPLMNTGIYIVDKWGNLLPPGVVGEIRIGGVQVGRGYLNRPELTAERFYRSHRSYRSYISYLSYYHTGDIGKWRPDGNIEFLGRKDNQVKIRGYRIELGEIESRLLNHPGIKEAAAAVGVEETGDKYLCAYIVTNRDIEIPGLREYLSRDLPDYMIPSYFVPLEKIPLTPNGKIDRKSLPAPKLNASKKYEAPKDNVEVRLVELWSGVLGVEKEVIGISDNFFQLGGHSLKATIMVSKIHKVFEVKVPLTEIFKMPRIKELAAYIRVAIQDKYYDIKVVEEKEYYPLSSAQKRLYILQQMTPGSIAYNMPEIIPLPKEFEPGKIDETLKRMIKRHDTLRTSFHMVNDTPVQVVHDKVGFEIEYYDLTKECKDDIEKKNYKLQNTNKEDTSLTQTRDTSTIIKDFIRPFDLSNTPLLRAGLVNNTDGNNILLVDMHHIVSDGISISIFIKDFMDVYKGETLSLQKIRYKDFSAWQSHEKQKQTLKQQESYWLKEFAGEIPVLNLPADYSRPSFQTFVGSTLQFQLEEKESRALKSLTLKHQVTLFMLLIGVYTTFLSKLSGQEDILVGTPIAGRKHAQLENIIGMFVNTLVLRHFPLGRKTFSNWLAEVKKQTLAAFENQDYPFEELVEQVEVERDTSRNPLFDTMFVLQNVDIPVIEIPNLKLAPLDYETGLTKFDLTLSASETDQSLSFLFEYNTGLFKQESITGFANYLKRIITAVIENDTIKLGEIEITPEHEKRKILYEFNDTQIEYPREKTVHELFEKQVESTPDNNAIIGMNYDEEKIEQGVGTRFIASDPGRRMIHLTYRQLNEKSRQLAALLKEKGTLPDNIIGIMLKTSIDMIINIFAVLRAGAAYLPIDPDYPEERINYMLKDSGASILLATEDTENTENASSYPSNPSSLAYIIYTSGSTGRPRGVMVDHGKLVNLCTWHNRFYSVTAIDRAGKYAAEGFDASVWEIFPYLVAGASLYLVPHEIKLDIAALNCFFETRGITITFLPTPVCERFMELENHSLRSLLTGGDRLKNFIKRKYQLFNNYGPTENTVVATACPVNRSDTNIPIGKPIDNNFIFILSPGYYHVQPIGIPGELCISGNSLARGYLNNPELTADRFYRSNRSYKSYFSKKFYKTGDLALWLADGNIRFLGRIDYQVKIRGNRIELGEIENQLMALENIKQAVVINRKDNANQEYLCAYIAADTGFDTIELNKNLSRTLPAYMIPAYYVPIDKIPLTANGKVDGKSLPVPAEEDIGTQYIPPRNEAETALVKMWEEVLGITGVGIHDDFFNRGGDSLKLITLYSHINKRFPQKVKVQHLFDYRTIKELSDWITGGTSVTDAGDQDIKIKNIEF